MSKVEKSGTGVPTGRVEYMYIKLHDVIFTASTRIWLADPEHGSWHFEEVNGMPDTPVFYPDDTKSKHWTRVHKELDRSVAKQGGWQNIQPLADLDELIIDVVLGLTPLDGIMVRISFTIMYASLKTFLQAPNAGKWWHYGINGVNYPVFEVDLNADAWRAVYRQLDNALGLYYVDPWDMPSTFDNLDVLLDEISKDRSKEYLESASQYAAENYSDEWTVPEGWSFVYHKSDLGRSPFNLNGPLHKYFTEIEPGVYTEEDIAVHCKEQEAFYVRLMDKVSKLKWMNDAIEVLSSASVSTKRLITHDIGATYRERRDKILDLEWASRGVQLWIESNKQRRLRPVPFRADKSE